MRSDHFHCVLTSESDIHLIYRVASLALFTSGQGFSQHFSTLFHPIVGEYDLIGKNPQAADTIRNVDGYQAVFEELRNSISPELELIDSRVVTPIKDFQGILKQVRKSVTKRDHKVRLVLVFHSCHVYLTVTIAYRLRSV